MLTIIQYPLETGIVIALVVYGLILAWSLLARLKWLPGAIVRPVHYILTRLSQLPLIGRAVRATRRHPLSLGLVAAILVGILVPSLVISLAALIIEPYLGVGGIVFPPDGYLSRLQAWARERDVIVILDEVQASFGRTGKMFALEWDGIEPDILCVGKGLGGGVSIAAFLAESAITDALAPAELSGGNGGNYLACSAALAVIDIIEEEKLVDNARHVLYGRLFRGQVYGGFNHAGNTLQSVLNVKDTGGAGHAADVESGFSSGYLVARIRHCLAEIVYRNISGPELE